MLQPGSADVPVLAAPMYLLRVPVGLMMRDATEDTMLQLTMLPVSCIVGNVLLVKGAAECVLERCDRVMLPDGKVVPLTTAARASLMAAVERMADRALRILALAKRSDLPADLASYSGDAHTPAGRKLQDPAQYEAVETGLVFLGLAGLEDPPRPEVRGSIADCRSAGIRVIVITGRL